MAIMCVANVRPRFAARPPTVGPPALRGRPRGAGEVHAARVRASGKGYVVIVTARRLIHAGDCKEHLPTG